MPCYVDRDEVRRWRMQSVLLLALILVERAVACFWNAIKPRRADTQTDTDNDNTCGNMVRSFLWWDLDPRMVIIGLASFSSLSDGIICYLFLTSWDSHVVQTRSLPSRWFVPRWCLSSRIPLSRYVLLLFWWRSHFLWCPSRHFHIGRSRSPCLRSSSCPCVQIFIELRCQDKTKTESEHSACLSTDINSRCRPTHLIKGFEVVTAPAPNKNHARGGLRHFERRARKFHPVWLRFSSVRSSIRCDKSSYRRWNDGGEKDQWPTHILFSDQHAIWAVSHCVCVFISMSVCVCFMHERRRASWTTQEPNSSVFTSATQYFFECTQPKRLVVLYFPLLVFSSSFFFLPLLLLPFDSRCGQVCIAQARVIIWKRPNGWTSSKHSQLADHLWPTPSHVHRNYRKTHTHRHKREKRGRWTGTFKRTSGTLEWQSKKFKVTRHRAH